MGEALRSGLAVAADGAAAPALGRGGRCTVLALARGGTPRCGSAGLLSVLGQLLGGLL